MDEETDNTGAVPSERHARARLPDASGDPRPPSAPRAELPYRYPTRVLHLDPRHPRRRWCVGPNKNPPLEAVVVPTRVRLAEVGWETVGMGLVFLVVMLLYVWWTSMDVMLAGWVFLGFVAVIFLWRYLVSDVPPPLVAGSGWVGNAYGRGSRVVAVYELTRIDAGPALDGDGEPIPGTVALHLSSPGNPRRDLLVDLARLQTNPALWDLVHHGITHSIAAGAELTEEARKTLRRP